MCGSIELGLGLMYALVLVMFMGMCAIAAGLANQSSHCCIQLAGEPAGAEWKGARVRTGAPKLVGVLPHSPAATQGLGCFVDRVAVEIDGRAVPDVAEAERLLAAGAWPGAQTVRLKFAGRNSIMKTLGDAIGPTATGHLDMAMGDFAWWAFAAHLLLLVKPIPSSVGQALVALAVSLLLSALSFGIFIANRAAWVLQLHKLEEGESQGGRTADPEEGAPTAEFRLGDMSAHLENDAHGPMMPGVASGVMVPFHRRAAKDKPHPAVAQHMQQLRRAMDGWVDGDSPEDVQQFYEELSRWAAGKAEEAAKGCPGSTEQHNSGSRLPLLIGAD